MGEIMKHTLTLLTALLLAPLAFSDAAELSARRDAPDGDSEEATPAKERKKAKQ